MYVCIVFVSTYPCRNAFRSGTPALVLSRIDRSHRGAGGACSWRREAAAVEAADVSTQKMNSTSCL